jgi:hypothetical protein
LHKNSLKQWNPAGANLEPQPNADAFLSPTFGRSSKSTYVLKAL